MFDINPIFFYWDGDIHPNRLQILKDSIYSTRVFNPNREIVVITNTLEQSQFEDRFRIKVLKWDKSFFEGIPMSDKKIEKYINGNPRDFSDLFRLILLYQFGGSYIDTDDLCINKMSDTHNLICRSYDPHTSFYNKISDEDCVPGWVREIKGWDEINTFPRNDCWQNWKPQSPFIWEMLNNPKFQEYDDIVWIGGDWSWQSITNETCNSKLSTFGKEWNYGLTLLYLFEDFVSASSFWDRCLHGGEMCELWKELPYVNNYEWGFYKCKKDIALEFYQKVVTKYPYLSHMWLHSKDQKEEWLIDLNENGEYSVSTWIYNDIKEKIKCFQ